MARVLIVAVAAAFLVASALPGFAMMRSNVLNPDYKYGKFQTGAASPNVDMTKPPKAKRKPKSR